MAVTTFDQALLEEAHKLDQEGKRRVLAYARALASRPKGLSGEESTRIAKEIKFSKEGLEEMAKAIEDVDKFDYWEFKSEPVAVKLLDVVALRRDLPDHRLRRGQVGTVVEELNAGVFEVEFSDHNGHSYATLAIKAEDLIVLHYEPTQANQ